MTETNIMQEISIPYTTIKIQRSKYNDQNTTIKSGLAEPLLLQEAGTPVAAVISMEDYRRYQQFRQQQT